MKKAEYTEKELWEGYNKMTKQPYNWKVGVQKAARNTAFFLTPYLLAVYVGLDPVLVTTGAVFGASLGWNWFKNRK